MSGDIKAPIIGFSKQLLASRGDTPAGMGWTDADAGLRYQAMLDLIRPSAASATLLDFGCGSAQLLDYINSKGVPKVEYRGLEISKPALSLCRKKYPGTEFLELDVLAPGIQWPIFDYIVMNGIFTWRGPISHGNMFSYLRKLVATVFEHARVGIAFNVMSEQVDWQREDLFHVPIDPLITYLSREVSRHFVVRADYGLYEYTVYVYWNPVAGGLPGTRRLIGPADKGEPGR